MLQSSFEQFDTFKTTLPTFHSEESSIMCQICCKAHPFFYFSSVGCHHLFCKQCLQSHIKQLIDNYQLIKCAQSECNHIIDYTPKSVYHFLDHKTKKIVDSILSNYKRMNTIKICKNCKKGNLLQFIEDEKVILICNQCNQKHCYNCFKPLHREQSYCTSEEQIQLPKDCQQCRKCSTIIQKQLGCKHMKCLCGYEFCFECGFHWDSSHICEHRIPKRHGISKFCCFSIKIILIVPLFLCLLVFLTTIILSVCLVSGAIGGVIVWGQFVRYCFSTQKNGKIHLQQTKLQKRDEPNPFFQCLLLLLSIILFPLFCILFGLIGFVAPIVNICYEKKFFLSPHVLSEVFGEIYKWIQIFMIL